MILLVDTSIWADHIVKPDPILAGVLANNGVMHPLVVGELAMGSLPSRQRILGYLDSLPKAEIASNAEVRYAVERHDWPGTGLSYIDAHLLVSTLITADGFIHTRDKRLAAAAARLEVLAVPV